MDNRFLILFDRAAERYGTVDGVELTRHYLADGNSRSVVVELEGLDDLALTINCDSDGAVEQVCEQLCESYLHHPGILDLRGIKICPSDIDEE